MAEQELNYMQDLQIDQAALDLEWVSLPTKIMRYSVAYSQAGFDRDRAKQNLDVVRANLDASIRAELMTAGAKFTEAVVDGRIKTSPTYLEAQDRHMKAEREASMMQQAVYAFQALKTALENLTKLKGMNYYSDAYVPPEMTQSAMEGGRAAQEEALGKAMGEEAPPRPAPLRSPLKRP